MGERQTVAAITGQYIQIYCMLAVDRNHQFILNFMPANKPKRDTQTHRLGAAYNTIITYNKNNLAFYGRIKL